MKKIQVKSFAEIFGAQIPVAKIKDANTRREIVLLAMSFSKPAKEVDAELEDLRVKLTAGHEAEINKWNELTNKAKFGRDISDEERKKLIEEADACTEAIRINNEYKEAATAILNEEAPEFPIRKIEFTTLIDALVDSGWLNETAGVKAVSDDFKLIVK